MNEMSPGSASGITQQDHFTLFDVLLTLKRHSRRLALVTLACGAMAFGATYLVQPKFTGTAKFMPPAAQQSSGLAGLLGGSGLGGLAGSLSGGGKTTPDMWIGFMRSRTVEDAIIQRFDLVKRYRQEFQFKTRQMLESRTSASAGKDGLITVEVQDTDPEMAAKLANAYIDELQKLNDTLAVSDAAQRRLFFEQQLRQANESLVKAEAALRSTGVGESFLKASPEATADLVGQLKARELEAEIKASVLRSRVTENAPEWRQVQQELQSLRRQLQTAMNAPVPAGAASGATASDGGYLKRYRDFKYAETVFETMARQYELARIDEAKEGSLLQVVDRAVAPEWKSSPKRLLTALIAAVVGFALMMIRLLMRQSLSAACAANPSLSTTLAALQAARWFR